MGSVVPLATGGAGGGIDEAIKGPVTAYLPGFSAPRTKRSAPPCCAFDEGSMVRVCVACDARLCASHAPSHLCKKLRRCHECRRKLPLSAPPCTCGWRFCDRHAIGGSEHACEVSWKRRESGVLHRRLVIEDDPEDDRLDGLPRRKRSRRSDL